jgi:uncharacterized membrane protein
MSKAIIVVVIVLGLLIGIIMSLRSSAKTGMPSEEVLKRATQHARELDAQEKSNQERDGK